MQRSCCRYYKSRFQLQVTSLGPQITFSLKLFLSCSDAGLYCARMLLYPLSSQFIRQLALLLSVLKHYALKVTLYLLSTITINVQVFILVQTVSFQTVCRYLGVAFQIKYQSG